MGKAKDRRRSHNRALGIAVVLVSLHLAAGFCLATALAADGVAGPAMAPAPVVRMDLAVAVAAAIGLPCLAAGYAVGRVGAAALGAGSERPELLMRSLIFVALGEGLAIFGFVIALVLALKM